jgi:hypothetical protein
LIEINERRAEPRSPVDIHAQVIIHTNNECSALDGHITDVSSSGFRVVTSRYFVRGKRLLVLYNDLEISCEVRNCRSTGIYQFQVGVQILDTKYRTVNPLWP